MMFFRLRYAEERIDFRKQARQYIARAQHFEKARGFFFTERAFQLRPYPLWHQMIHLA